MGTKCRCVVCPAPFHCPSHPLGRDNYQYYCMCIITVVTTTNFQHEFPRKPSLDQHCSCCCCSNAQPSYIGPSLSTARRQKRHCFHACTHHMLTTIGLFYNSSSEAQPSYIGPCLPTARRQKRHCFHACTHSC